MLPPLVDGVKYPQTARRDGYVKSDRRIIRGENAFSLRLSSLAAAEHASSSFGLGNSTTGTSSSPLVFFVQQAGI